MRRTHAVVIGAALLAMTAGLVGAAGSGQPVPAATQLNQPVVTPDGLSGVEFGEDRAALTRDHGLRQGPGDCAPRLPEQPAVSPVLDRDRLVLLWADPPVQTSDGFSVGTPIAQVRAAYPQAEELTAPSGSYRFDGTLVRLDGDRAYLFLHDQQQVQKLIVGYEHHARLLFSDGFGTC